MKILVINGDCIQVNSSANLCHIAYLKGLVDLGHAVTLLSADGRDYCLDQSICVPEEVKQYTYYSVSLYQKLSIGKRRANIASPSLHVQDVLNRRTSARWQVVKRLKGFILSLYGAYGINTRFIRAAQQFRSFELYDYVISISTPPASHMVAHNLLKAGHIKATHWIQIWEDPWYNDIYGISHKDSVYKEERRLLSCAEKVCYVSPLTLKNQQRLFPESAHKMYWHPLPYYYKNENRDNSFLDNSYGYFGDYMPKARDLKPFYEAAKKTGIQVNICGDPSNLFSSTGNIKIHPRLPLNELKPIEDDTNILVFLCNRKGGQIPGKIYQYSATNKTILFILDGTSEEKRILKDFFGKYNRYVFCENNVCDITRAIKDIENGNTSDVNNDPLEAFNPKETVRNVLEG